MLNKPSPVWRREVNRWTKVALQCLHEVGGIDWSAVPHEHFKPPAASVKGIVSDGGERLEWLRFPIENLETLTRPALLAWVRPAPDTGDVPHVQIWRDAFDVVIYAHKALRAANAGAVDDSLDALAKHQDAAERLRMSVNYPERTGWMREEDVIKDARRGHGVAVTQRSAADRGAEERRTAGDIARERTAEAWDDFVARNAREPSSVELARKLRIDASSIRRHVRDLKKNGRIPR